MDDGSVNQRVVGFMLKKMQLEDHDSAWNGREAVERFERLGLAWHAQVTAART